MFLCTKVCLAKIVNLCRQRKFNKRQWSRAVLVGVVGGDAEACHLGVADVLDAGIPDDAAENN